MVAFRLKVLFIFVIFHVSICTRRIQEGEIVTSHKPYVVYLVKAPTASARYDYWLCGGALISTLFVVTSAACIKDVNYLYVIAGYDKYVTDDQIELDPCTKKKKKKVIYTCFPSGYEIRYDKLDKWALIDIGVVKVESPYDFKDESYKEFCTYIPSIIPISYEAKYQEPGTDAIVMGWGHLSHWRKESDKTNLNQEKLSYAPVVIIDKEECKRYYEDYQNMTEVIDKYMICSMGGGNINDKGDAIKVNGDKHKECTAVLTSRSQASQAEETRLSLKYEEPVCSEEEANLSDMENNRRRRNLKRKHNMVRRKKKNSVLKTASGGNGTLASYRASLSNMSTSSTNSPTEQSGKQTRRSGICQNDHGGPLVTWIGSHEMLIGIASVFKVSEDSECQGPYLYTSTQCNGAFLDCILERAEWPQSSTKNRSSESRRRLCKKDVNDPGQSTVERHISWLYHPHGAAENELEINGKHGSGITTVSQYKKNAILKQKTRHPSNGGNSGNVRYQQNGGHANVGYPPTKGYFTKEVYPPNEGYPSNVRYSSNSGNQPFGEYKPNGGYSPNQGYLPNGEYPQGRYLPNEGYPPPNMAYQHNAGYPPNMAPPGMSGASQIHTDNINYFPPNIRKPGVGQTFHNDHASQNRYPHIGRNPKNSMPSVTSKPDRSVLRPFIMRPQRPLHL